jgi:hypothetical protein
MSRRSKKKRRNRVTVSPSSPYDQVDGKPSPSSDLRPVGRHGPGDKQADIGAQPTAPASRGLHLVDSPDRHEPAERSVAVFAPAGSDRSDVPIDYVGESCARKLIADRIGTFVRINRNVSGNRLFPEPPRATVKKVSIRGGSFDKLIDFDTEDNFRGVWSYANRPIFEHYVDPAGRRRRRRIPATTQNYETLPAWCRDHVFLRVLLDCIKPAA